MQNAADYMDADKLQKNKEDIDKPAICMVAYNTY